MARTTNPKHTEPTRNHPANEQTPPHYEAEKPNASAEPSDARPAAPTPGGQSRRAQDHRPNTAAHHTAEDGMQQRAPKPKAVHKASHCANVPPPVTQKQSPHESATHEKKTHTIQVLEHPNTHTPARSSPARRPTPWLTKGKTAHRAKTKTHPEAETNPPRDQPRPARTLEPCRPLRTPSPRQKRDRRQ
ncbi:hypothetical protein AMECASPLE_033166 [Ameca splendens]|uniref:Uncharacterized protein n=1 Tax=Ameca splendens TaxID=208324 RepID=A0ABV0XJU2_9TELE